MTLQLLKQRTSISLLLLMVLLFATVSHSHEFPLDSHSIEQLDCKLCQQQVDPPKQPVKPAQITLGSFSVILVELIEQRALVANYWQFAPRGPPFFA